MEFGVLTIIALMIASFVAGFIDSIAGGGGLLTIPSLLLAGLSPHLALGTNKFSSTLGTGVSVVNFTRHGKVSLEIILSGIIFSLFGAFIGAKTVLLCDQGLVIRIMLFLFPMAVFATLYPKKNLVHKGNLKRKDLYIKVPFIGLIIGFYDGLFGPGTGTFLALSFYAILKLDIIEATANAKVFNLISNLSALVTFIANGKVFYLIGLPMALTNMIGNYAGSCLVIKSGERVVRVFLIIVLTILFITLIFKLS